METVVIVIHLMVVLALVLVVLLQRSEGGALGIGGGGGLMSSRGTANVLTRATGILAAAFFVTSLGLSLIAKMSETPASVLDSVTTEQSAPSAPEGTGNGILDALKPAEPTGPQVPAAQ
ncbi:MAG: preprotein translocase subunit SecG [Rhodobacteraceae bacterium]|nr:preprotein translocase subunit SecG [Paracoccaceae bacterium]